MKRVARKATVTKPAVGTVLERRFKGRTLKVEVTADGFRHGGKVWPSLTRLAMHVTGYKAVSGPAFFRLTKPARAQTAAGPTAPPKARKAAKG